MKVSGWLASIFIAPLMLMGCAPKQEMANTRVVEPTAAARPEAAQPEAETVSYDHYMVRKGDCLWTIAGRSRVFGDPFAWPLLYRENRDQIQDPDLIYPRQHFQYAVKPTAEDLADARKTAEATPAYHPHRRELPVE